MVLTKQVILTDKAPKPLSVLNQGLVVGDMVYCSGQVGTDPATGELVEGTVADRAVSYSMAANGEDF
jgi:2-iminobutanoate/2-iminopropanoate deaminase